jgi:hypothetical protein
MPVRRAARAERAPPASPSRSRGRRSSGAPPSSAAAGWRSSRTPRWWGAWGALRVSRVTARCVTAGCTTTPARWGSRGWAGRTPGCSARRRR